MIPHFSKNLTRNAVASAQINFSGRWMNVLGSEMTLTVSKEEVKGIYKTAVGEAPEAEVFELVGYVKDDLIVFCVNFGAYGSLTAWAGQHTTEKGKEKILSLWHLARNTVDWYDPKHLWSTMLTGANTFTRITQSGY